MRPRKKNKGLPNRVYKRGPSFYYVHPSGKWEKLGRSEAEMYAQLARIHGHHGGTVNAMLDRYALEVIPGKAESTQRAQAGQLDVIRKAFGHMKPESIRKSDIAAFLDRYPSPVNANRIAALFSHVFTMGIRWGMVEDNPCRLVMRNKEKPRSRYVSDDEYRQVRASVAPHIGLIMDMAYCTGQRQGDLLALRWPAIRQDGIYFMQTKTGKRLIVEHSPFQVATVKALWPRRAGDVVFTNARGRPMTSSGLQSYWQRLRPGFTFHDIRAKSASDHATGEHLGHDSDAMLKRVYRRAAKRVRGL